MPPQTTPTVSVIVPNYNHARYLSRRIDSILTQTYQDFELVLLDDCSTDESRELLNSYGVDPRVRIEFNEVNSGTTFRQWNKGVKMARGRYVWIAESDDYADPHFLERTVPILETQAEISFVYCRAWRVGEDDQQWGYADSYLDRLDEKHWKNDFVADGRDECRRFFVLCAPVWNASGVLFRKEAYERAGMADERMRVSADYKVWAEMALAGKVAYVAQALNYYRTHPASVRSRTEADGLMLAEYFCAMRWVVARVSALEMPATQPSSDDVDGRMPADMTPSERIAAAKRWLEAAAKWNLQNNTHVSRTAVRSYFMDWEFALTGQGFAIVPPNRWQFFGHRCRFYRHYFGGMSWKQRAVNFGRLVGAPVVGYQNRHWPEEAYARTTRALYMLLRRAG